MRNINLMILFLFLPFLSAFSPVGFSAQSLDWQKIELERNINQRVINSISPVIRSGEYIVNTQVFMKPPGQLKAGGGGAGGDDKNKNKKNKINFNDIDPSKAKGDFVVFSKLGLEAPVFKEDEKEGGKSGSEAKEWQEFLTQYIEVNDLARHIDKIVIDIKLDNYLGDDTKKTVEDILKSVSLGFGNAKADVKLSYIDMKEMKKEIEQKRDKQSREFYEWIGKLGAPIGIVLAVILLGIFALVIFKKYAALHEKQMEMMKNQMMQQNPQPENKEPEDKKDNAQTPSGLSTLGENESDNGMERFKSILKTNQVEAALMVKKWISEPLKMNHLALKCLVKELSSDELSSLFTHLNMDERKEWKRIIAKPSKDEELKEARRFIGVQVVQEMIIPNTISDHEMIELLLKVKAEDCAKLAREDSAIGSYLLNVMNTKFVTKLLNELSSDEVQKIIRMGINTTQDQFDQMMDRFKQKLNSSIKTDKISPMIEKIIELIPVTSLSNERTLYSSLVEAGQLKVVIDLAKRNIPFDIVFKMPDQLIKNLIQSYPREKRPEVVFMVEDGRKDWIKSIIAPNQKSQDMLSLDLEKYTNNPDLNKRITENLTTVQQEFLDHCRKQIKLNPALQKDLEHVIVTWMNSFGVDSNQNDSNLKLAA